LYVTFLIPIFPIPLCAKLKIALANVANTEYLGRQIASLARVMPQRPSMIETVALALHESEARWEALGYI
jgi:hypothetical protein